MWFIGVEVEQETSAPPPKKNPGSAPELAINWPLLGCVQSSTSLLDFTSLKKIKIIVQKEQNNRELLQPRRRLQQQRGKQKGFYEQTLSTFL